MESMAPELDRGKDEEDKKLLLEEDSYSDSDSESDVPQCMLRAVRTLGQGGFAKVVLATATAPTLPPLLAVKMATYSPSQPDSLDSLLREADFYDLLPESPYIIRSYGLQTIDDDETGRLHHVNLFLEYAAAGSLDDYLLSFPRGLPEPRVRSFTASILRGVHHLHQNRLVHCDLKPGNVLLTPSFRSFDFATLGLAPKIADLGLAKFVGDDSGFRGTPMYMAPESVSRHIHEPPSDIWAIGCIVLQLLTGQPPWDHDLAASETHLLDVIGHDPTTLPLVPDHLSPQAKDFLDKCLVRDWGCRWTAEMLLSHPFISMTTNANHQVSNTQRGSLKRSYDDDGEQGLGSLDYIPLEPCPKRNKNTSQAHIPSTSGSGDLLSLSLRL